jgi:CBS domain-containing protein
MKDILVSDVMTRNPVTISPFTNLLECAKKMVTKKVGGLIIVDNNKLVGLLSQKDILWVLTKKPIQDLTKIKAIDISPKKIAVISPDSTINDAMQKMNKLKFERLPVMHENRLVGVITSKEIIKLHSESYLELEEFEHIRQESEKLENKKRIEKKREGICEECGHEGTLSRVDGMLICESCKESS